MTDKEQIMIHGVDVSECEFYVHSDYGKFPHGCSLHKDMFGLPVCCDVADCCKNCYFKQLARKTQECEQKEKELKELNHQYKLSCLDCEYKNTKADVDRYSKALEEIEKYLEDEEWSMLDFTIRDIKDIINKAKGENKNE